jgi:hypothetical protein
MHPLQPITPAELYKRGLHVKCAPYLIERVLECLRAEHGRMQAAEAILGGKAESLHPAELIAGAQWIAEWQEGESAAVPIDTRQGDDRARA